MEVETGGTEAHLATKRLECPLQDVFEDYTPFPIRKRALKGNSGINIKIKMINNPVDNIRTERRNSSAFHHRTQSLPNEASVFPDGVLYKHAILNENQYSYDENDDSAGDMSFYQETHEDQLQSYRDLMKKRKEDALREGLARLDKEDREGRMSIESILSEQIKEKKAAAERSVERFKARVKEDEKRDRQRLNTLYQERTTSNQQKIAQSLKLLQRRQQKEIQAAMQHHQQKVQQRQLPEQMVSADWQNILRQLQSKHQRQLQEFNGKRDEIKKKTDADFKREEEKIRTSCETKLQEADNNNQKISAKIYNHFQQLRQRYFKRHLQTVMKKREDLNKSWRNAQDATNSDADDDPDLNSRDVVKSSDDKAELNPPSPIRSMQPWAEMPNHPHSGAAARHKHRKGVMSQTRRQLSVEIHNEGVWVLIMKSDSSSEEDDKRSQTVKADAISGGGDNTFIPWGLMAHSFLESIICGEIPDALHHAKVFDELAEIQGGQIRCIIADLRTSEETASSQRANSVRDIEVSEMELLQKKCVELNKVLAETEKEIMKVQSEEKECLTAAEAASKEVAKARRCQDDFRNKFRGYFGQGTLSHCFYQAFFNSKFSWSFFCLDGNPLPTTNPSDRQELVKAMMQYKTHLETAMRREQTLKQKLAYSRTQLQRLQVQVKTASKDAQLASTEFAQKRTSLGQSQQSSSSSKSTKAAKNKQIAVEDKDRVAIRVKDCVAALSKTAEKRREASRQKQSNSFSSAWVQSLPGLSNSLKKSLWHKMHRRKQQIVLRPTEESLANGLLTFVADKMRPKSETPENQKQDEDKLLAEQLFLLAMHPLCEEELSTHPPTRNSESWAEPGWKLVLDTRRTCHSEHAILPSSSVTPLLGQNISEMSSTPGRQAASLIRSWNLRCLSSPLSSFTIASSPAEPAASPLTSKSFALVAVNARLESNTRCSVQGNTQTTTRFLRPRMKSRKVIALH